ncbi:hypothetical protein DYB30_014312, partial [Aphanomyces astaci]
TESQVTGLHRTGEKYCNSLHAVLVGIVVPEVDTVVKLAKSLGIPSSDIVELCRHGEVVAAMHKDIVRMCKAAGLHSFETVKAIILHPKPFSVGNGLLTPKFKLKRQEGVLAHHQRLVLASGGR